MKVASLPRSRVLGHELALLLASDHIPLECRKFPDGETYLRIPVSIEGEEVALVQSAALEPNEAIMEFVMASATLKDLGATRVIGILPYLPYARQDARFMPGEAVSITILARLIEASGVDELYTVDAHLHRFRDLSEIFAIPAHNLTAMPLLASYALERFKLQNPVVVGPDEESLQWAVKAAETLDCPYTTLVKRRVSEQEVKLTAPGEFRVKDRDVLIVDDIVSTGGTMATAAKILVERGARRIIAACTHALLVGDALYRIVSSGVDILISTNTVLSPVSRVSVAPLIAESLGMR